MTRIFLALGLIFLAACDTRMPGGVDWFGYTSGMQATGFMRTDRDPADAPFAAADIERGFEFSVFNPEDDPFATGEALKSTVDRRFLRKWAGPITYEIFDDWADQGQLRRKVATMMKRLHLATGLRITERETAADGETEPPSPNFLIVLGSDPTFAWLEKSAKTAPSSATDGARVEFGWLGENIRQWRRAPSPCSGTLLLADSHSDGHRPGEILVAMVFLRREMPEALLDACVEEELAQALGPVGDHGMLRPSIFNDDGEFALLTAHDEAILRTLYDPRLTPGMSRDVAMPLVRQIIRENGYGS